MFRPALLQTATVYSQSSCLDIRTTGIVGVSCCLAGNIGRLVDPVMETSRTGLEAELLGLCSGKFISQPMNVHSLEQDERQSVPTEDPAE
jgi:hypothetical protein